MLTHQILRLAADTASFANPLDLRRQATPSFWRGSDIVFQLAFFDNAVLLDPSGFASCTIELRPAGLGLAAPAPGTAPVLSRTTGGFNAALTLSNWQNGSDQHLTVTFSHEETALDAGDYWLTVHLTTTGSPGTRLTCLAGPLRVFADGFTNGLSAPVPAPAAYTEAEADARFLQSAQNLADLASPALARTHLDVPSTGDVRTTVYAGLRGRLYRGGHTLLSINPAANNLFVNGGEVMFLLCPVRYLNDVVVATSWNWMVELHPEGALARIRFYASFSSGTFVVETTAAVLPLQRFSWLRLRWTGLPSLDAIEIWLDGTRLDLSLVLAGSGTFLADDQPLMLGNDFDLAFPFYGVLARYLPLNYLLDESQWTTFLQTGLLPTWNDPGSRLNRCPSGSFESGAGTFTLVGGASLVTTAPRSGSTHLSLASSAHIAYVNGQFELGRWYRIILWARTSGSGTALLRVGHTNVIVPIPLALNDGSLQATNTLTSTTYQRLDSGPFRVESGTRLEIRIDAASTTGVFIDDLSVESAGILWQGDLGQGLGRQVTDNVTGADGLDAASGIEVWPAPTASSPLVVRHLSCATDTYLLDAIQPLLPPGVGLFDSVEVVNHSTTTTVTGLKIQASDKSTHLDLTTALSVSPSNTTRFFSLASVPDNLRFLRIPANATATDISLVFWQRQNVRP